MNVQGFFVAAPSDDGDAVTGHHYETASPDPSRAQVWGYTGKLSYAPGEVPALHAMSSAAAIRLEILRDGLVPEVMDLQMSRNAHLTGRRWFVGSATMLIIRVRPWATRSGTPPVRPRASGPDIFLPETHRFPRRGEIP